MNTLNFPSNFKKSKRYKELENLVNSITNHKSMLVNEKHVLDNMVRASLMFTVCFWGNTLSLLHLALENLKQKNALAVKKDTTFIHLFLELASGELATKNIPTKQNIYSPHYVPMLEATNDAGVDPNKIENFVSEIGKNNLKELCGKLQFSKPVIDYLSYSERCTKTFDTSFATIALRELTLSMNFKIILENLPKDKKYDKYKVFLSKHIKLDETEHGIIMKKALEEFGKVDELIDVMIKFYTFRKNVYDACLLNKPIF